MKKWLKRIFGFLGILLLLIILIVLWLQTSWGKSFVRKEAVSYLHKKLGTEVQIGQIDYHLPKWLELKGVMIKDKQNDTLIYGQSLLVDLDMLKLINSNIVINKVDLQHIFLNTYRKANDTAFSYQFVMDAFVTPSSKPDTTPSKPLQLSLDKFYMTDVRIKYMDYHDKMFLNTNIGNLTSTFKSVDVAKMSFNIADLAVKNTYAIIMDESKKDISTIKPLDTATASASPGIRLLGGKLNLDAVVFYYSSASSSMISNNGINHFAMENLDIDMGKTAVTIGNIDLDKSSFDLQTIIPPAKKDTVNAAIKDSVTNSGWNIAINKIELDHNNFNFDNNYFKLLPNQFDANHVHAKDISLATDNIAYNTNVTKANIKSGSVDLNGRVINALQTDFQMDSAGLSAKDIVIRTKLSHINGAADVVYNKDAKGQIFNDNTAISTKLDSTILSLDDVYFFAPFLRPQMEAYLPNTNYIKIQAVAKGTVKSLGIQQLDFATSDGAIRMNASGRLGNIMDPNKLEYDVAVKPLFIQTNLLPASLKANLKKSGLQLPPTITLTGSAKGNMKEVQPNIAMVSGFGNANISGTVTNFTDTKNLSYNIKLVANNLETGKWVGMDSLAGKLTGSIAANGNGIDVKKLNLSAIADVKSIRLNNYTYQGINIKSTLKNGLYSLTGNINDPNLQTDLDVKGSMKGAYPTAKGFINVVKADFRKLGFTADTINLTSNIVLDVKSVDPKNLDATVDLTKTSLDYKGQNFALDSMYAKAETIGDTSKVNLVLPFATALLVGKFDYTKLPATITQFIQKNYLKNDTTTTLVVPQQAQLVVNVQQNDLLKKFAPNLELPEPINLNANFNSNTQDSVLTVNLSIPNLKYSTTTINNLTLKANGTAPELNALLVANEISMSDSTTKKVTKYENPNVSINYKNDLATIRASVQDANKKPFYAVKSLINVKKNDIIISLADSLKLNYADWTVNDSNAIHIINGAWYVDNFDLRYRGHSINITSDRPDTLAPVTLKIVDFNLSDLLAIARTDTLLAGGVLNANFKLQKPITALPIVDGTMDIKKLTYRGNEIGDLNFSANTDANQLVTLKGAVTGSNSLTIDGTYSVPNQTVNVNTVLQRFDMATAQVFSGGMLQRSAGSMHGNVYLSGPVSDIRWTGGLAFDSVHFAAAGLNSLYSINKQQINFGYPDISFDHFTITDSANHAFTIDGNITEKKLPEFALDLHLTADNFFASNSKSVTDAVPFYGVAVMSANMDIQGTTNSPDIAGQATLENESNITYVLPQTSSYKDNGEGIVRFVDADSLDNFIKVYNTVNKDTLAQPTFQGLKYNLNLEVKPEANIAVIIDPTTGDNLKIKGAADLNAGVDENGQMGITGVYNLKQGTYSFTYQFIKKDFTLKDGSTITFSGNPMNGVADVTAQYEVLASAKDLLGNEITETSGNLGAGYSAKIPFDVLLHITGPIMKPKIDFSIQLKAGADGVNQSLTEAIQNKLDQLNADEASRTKQVFALLIMGRFIGETSNDFFAGTGGNTSTADQVKNSVSEFLAQAVQQIASDLIKGVDVNIDLKNTEATDQTGARSDLNIGLTKRLLDDRLSVSVGKSFNIDGNDGSAAKSSSGSLDFLPDITTSYKLSKNGKYMIKLYRKNAYEAILDGYFIETGVTFSLNLDYNQLKELFSKKPKQ